MAEHQTQSDPPRGPAKQGVVRRYVFGLVRWLRSWAASGWGGAAVFAWGVAQGAVIPGPSDALLFPLGLAHPRRVWRLVIFAIVGSTIGGTIAYAIGAFGFEGVRPMLRWLGLGEDELQQVQPLVEQYGALVVAGSAVAIISTKAVCIVAGALGMSLVSFIPAMLAGRVVRFSVSALLIRFGGDRFRAWLERKAGQPLTVGGEER